MNKDSRALVAFFVVLLGACAPGASQESPIEIHIDVHRVSSRVVVLESLDANVTAIAAEKGVVLIDTHRSPSVMKQLVKAVERELGRSDIRYVVNTHGHWDHASGNQLFPDAVLIGHESCPEYMRQNPLDSLGNKWYLEERLSISRHVLNGLREDDPPAARLRGEVMARGMIVRDLAGGYIVTPPSRTFRDRLSLDLGDVTLALAFAGENHTDNDIIAYVPEERLVATGDLFSTRTNFGFSVNKMMEIPRLLSVLEETLGNEAGVSVVVPGHGDLMTGEDLLAIRDQLQEQYAALGEEPSAARTLQALIEEHGVRVAVQRFKKMRSGKAPGAGYVSESEFDTLGFRLLGKGLIQEAVEVFKISVEAIPESALLHDSLGAAYLKSGDREAAGRSYARALELNPYNKNASEMLRALREGSPGDTPRDDGGRRSNP